MSGLVLGFCNLRFARASLLFLLGVANGPASGLFCSAQGGITNQSTLLLVVGAPGEAEFATNFQHQATLWSEAAVRGGCKVLTIGVETQSATNDFELLRQALSSEEPGGTAPFWLVMIGHGTFDGKEARFNLRGPDVSAGELTKWIQPFTRPMAIINTASSSAPFLNKLSGTNRVVITATRSGNEQNYTHFGRYLAEAISDPEADLDKDGEVSLLEAFLVAARKTTEFYKLANRLATEHALIDDNGDGLGTSADWFRGLRAVKTPAEKAGVDGLLAQQFHLAPGPAEQALSAQARAARDALERAVMLHREKKAQLPEKEYYVELEQLLLKLAVFYESNRLDFGRSPR